MSSARPAWANSGTERFTAMRRRGKRPRCHAFACRQASRTTHSPIGTIIRVSSAMGMKLIGSTTPTSGRFQRSSASTPTISFVATLICGW